MANRSVLARITRYAVTAVALAAFPAVILAQNPASSDTESRPYDKRDFSGLWSRNPGEYELPACNECRDQGPAPGYGFFGTPPPRTPAGEKRFQLNKPGRGWELGSKEAADRLNLDAGYRRAVLPAF